MNGFHGKETPLPMEKDEKEDSRGPGAKEASEMTKNDKGLEVWKKAHELCLKIYKKTKTFPTEERFGLTAQGRRAALSIPSNIAEGYGRRATGKYIQALKVLEKGTLNP